MADDFDLQIMQRALFLARQGQVQNEVPVGAVITLNHEIIAEAWNQPITCHDPTAHAEMLALRAAGQHLQNYRLLGTTLYVTLEPCAMCLTAMIHARIQRLVFACPDPKTGAVMSVQQLIDHTSNNHRIQWSGGVLAPECSELLSNFFKKRRAEKNGI